MTMRMNATTTALFVLIATFVGGLLTGVLVERTLLATPAMAEASPRATAPRGDRSADRARMAEELALTADQQARIDEILDEQQHQVRKIMSETRPRTRSVLRETRVRIEEILTPEQREQFAEMHKSAHGRVRSERGQ